MPNGDVQQSDPGKWQRIARLLSQGGARWAAAFGHPQALQMEQERDRQQRLAEQEAYQRDIQRRAETRAESRESREAGLYGLRRQGLQQGIRRGQRLYDVAPKTREEELRYKREEAEVGRAPVAGPGGVMYRMERGRMVPVERAITPTEVFEEMQQGKGGFRPVDVPFKVPEKPDTSTSMTELRMLAAQGNPVAIAVLDRMERHQRSLRESTAGPRQATPGQRAMLKQRMDKALRDAEADFAETQGSEEAWMALPQAERQAALDRLRKVKQRIHDDFEGQWEILTGGAEIKHVTVPRRRAKPEPVEPPRSWLPDWLTNLFDGGTQQPVPTPPAPTTLAPTPPPVVPIPEAAEDRVRVIDAQGNTGTIPRSQLEAALQQGYRVAPR